MRGRPRAVVWVVEVTAAGPLGWRAGEAILDDADRARYERLARPEDRYRLAASRAVLADLLRARWGREASVLHRPGRAPELAGRGLRLSLAHSGEVVVAAAASGPIGVDVERRSAGSASGTREALVEALHPAERRHLGDRPPGPGEVRLWARKEAVLKAAGEVDLAHMSGIDARRSLIRHGRLPGLWRLVDMPVSGAYAAAAAFVPWCRLAVERPDPAARP